MLTIYEGEKKCWDLPMKCFFRAVRVCVSFLLSSQIVSNAFAVDNGGNVGVESIAPPVCTINSAPEVKSQSNMSLDASSANSTSLRIYELLEPDTARLRPASMRISVNAVCNTSYYLRLTSTKGHMLPEAEVQVMSGAFLRSVNYAATVTFGTQTVTLVTDGTAGKTVRSANNHPEWGALEISINVDESNNRFDLPVVAQNYSDTIIIEIGATY